MQHLQYSLVYFVYKAQVMKVFHTQAGPDYSLSILLFSDIKTIKNQPASQTIQADFLVASISARALRGQRQGSALHPRFFCKKIE